MYASDRLFRISFLWRKENLQNQADVQATPQRSNLQCDTRFMKPAMNSVTSEGSRRKSLSLTQSGVCVATRFTVGSFCVIPEGQGGSPGTGREVNLRVFSLDGINGRVKRRDVEREPKKEGQVDIHQTGTLCYVCFPPPIRLLSHYGRIHEPFSVLCRTPVLGVTGR